MHVTYVPAPNAIWCLGICRRHEVQKLYACMMILPSKALAAFAALAVQGVGTAQDIDNGMKLGTNQPMGPLQLADFIGTHFIVLLLCCALLVWQTLLVYSPSCCCFAVHC